MAELIDGSRDDLGGRWHRSGARTELVSWFVEFRFEALNGFRRAAIDGRRNSDPRSFDQPPVQLVFSVVFAVKCQHGDAQHGALGRQVIARRADDGATTAERLGKQAHVRRMHFDTRWYAAWLTEQQHPVAAAGELLERHRSVAISEVCEDEVLSRREWIGFAAEIGSRHEGALRPRLHRCEVDGHSTASGPRRARHVDDFAQVPVKGQGGGQMCVMQNQAVTNRNDGDPQ